MLRITTRDDGAYAVLELEGRLAGPWVDELKRCWQLSTRGGKPVRLMLKEVSFIDTEGKRTLVEMHRQGVELAAEGCMIKAMVDEIRRGLRR